MNTVVTAPQLLAAGPFFLRLVMIEHSVFALPFAFIAALTAMRTDVRWAISVSSTVAMVAARTFAMAANRVIDREIDAAQPADRAPRARDGRRCRANGVRRRIVALAIFLTAAALLEPTLPRAVPDRACALRRLSVREADHELPHAVLLSRRPSRRSVRGSQSPDTGLGTAVVLGLAVGTWIGGFDLIYACQDAEVDRLIGVHSTPARWGVRVALVASALTPRRDVRVCSRSSACSNTSVRGGTPGSCSRR